MISLPMLGRLDLLFFIFLAFDIGDSSSKGIERNHGIIFFSEGCQPLSGLYFLA